MKVVEDTSEKRHHRVEVLQRVLNCWWPFVLLLFLPLPWTIQGAIASFGLISNDASDWFMRDLPGATDRQRIAELFGGDELLMIRWDGCALDDPRIDQYREQLLAEVQTTSGPVVYYRSVLTGPDLLGFFKEPPLSLSHEESIDNLRGWLVGADGQKTGLLALVSRAGAQNRAAAVDHVYAAANNVEGLSADELYVAGSTINGVAIDRASQNHLLELNLASYAVCILILCWLQGSVRVALLVFLTALFNEQLTMAMIHYSGTTLDSVLLLAANLTFVLSISVGVHLVNYYRDALLHVPKQLAPAWSCYLAAKPTALATLTTALGLASLQVSDIRPIVKFGLYSSIAVIAAAVLTMLLISLHFTIWPLKPGKEQSNPGQDQDFAGYTLFLRRARWAIVVLSFVGLVVGYHGSTKLKSSVGLHELVAGRNPVVRDYDHLEREIGPLTPIEVVIQTAPDDPRRLIDQFRAIEFVHETVAELSDEYTVLSIRTFSPPAPPEEGGFLTISNSVAFNRTLLQNQQKLQELGYLIMTPEDHYWRMTVRCPSSQSQGFGDIVSEVQQTVEAALAEYPEVEVRNVIVGGSVPMIYQTQQQMLDDLVNSFFSAFAMVAVVLMLVFRSVLCGLICMIPNVLPCAIAFGAMGYAGLPVDLGTILTASAALGIAVDDSMHFITWFQQSTAAGADAQQAVRQALRYCARAMIQTTLICALGLVVFCLSDFKPIANFGATMFTLLFLALVGDLVCLPALLLTPIGKPFLKRKNPQPDEENA